MPARIEPSLRASEDTYIDTYKPFESRCARVLNGSHPYNKCVNEAAPFFESVPTPAMSCCRLRLRSLAHQRARAVCTSAEVKGDALLDSRHISVFLLPLLITLVYVHLPDWRQCFPAEVACWYCAGLTVPSTVSHVCPCCNSPFVSSHLVLADQPLSWTTPT